MLWRFVKTVFMWMGRSAGEGTPGLILSRSSSQGRLIVFDKDPQAIEAGAKAG